MVVGGDVDVVGDVEVSVKFVGGNRLCIKIAWARELDARAQTHENAARVGCGE